MSLSILCITLSGVWWFPSGNDLFTLFVYSLSPYGLDPQTPKSQEASLWTQDFVPLGAIALFASSNPEYHEGVNKMVAKANLVYQDFLTSGEGKGFTGQVQSDLLSGLDRARALLDKYSPIYLHVVPNSHFIALRKEKTYYKDNPTHFIKIILQQISWEILLNPCTCIIFLYID